jgi:hypothetical protein
MRERVTPDESATDSSPRSSSFHSVAGVSSIGTQPSYPLRPEPTARPPDEDTRRCRRSCGENVGAPAAVAARESAVRRRSP